MDRPYRVEPAGYAKPPRSKSGAGSPQEGSRPPRSLMTRLLLVEVRTQCNHSPELLADYVVGPGGYVAAIKAAQLGLKVCCIHLLPFIMLIQCRRRVSRNAARWEGHVSTSDVSRPRLCLTIRTCTTRQNTTLSDGVLMVRVPLAEVLSYL